MLGTDSTSLSLDMKNKANFPDSNKEDLHMLEEMGVTPDSKSRAKRLTLRAVVFTVLATVRMQRQQREWAVHKKLQASLVKKAQQVQRLSRKTLNDSG